MTPSSATPGSLASAPTRSPTLLALSTSLAIDGSVVVVRHNGAAHDAISGPLGYWRKVRAREDRGIPRHAGWEAYATRRERAQNARCTSGAGEIAPGSSAHPDPRPAQSRLSKRSRNKPDLAGAGNRRSKP
jgi:hypothetical protein